MVRLIYELENRLPVKMSAAPFSEDGEDEHSGTGGSVVGDGEILEGTRVVEPTPLRQRSGSDQADQTEQERHGRKTHSIGAPASHSKIRGAVWHRDRGGSIGMVRKCSFGGD